MTRALADIQHSLPKPYYSTGLGGAYIGNSLKLMAQLPDDCIDLIVTSPPYALQLQKPYGNEAPEHWVDWFMPFALQIRRILKPKGSFVLNVGGAWKKGIPAKTTYQYEILVELCKERSDGL